MRQTTQVRVTGHGLRVSGHAVMRRAECGASVMLRAPLASDWGPAPLASGSGPAQDWSVAQVRRHHRPHARCHLWGALMGRHCHQELRVFAGTCPASASPSSPAACMRAGSEAAGETLLREGTSGVRGGSRACGGAAPAPGTFHGSLPPPRGSSRSRLAPARTNGARRAGPPRAPSPCTWRPAPPHTDGRGRRTLSFLADGGRAARPRFLCSRPGHRDRVTVLCFERETSWKRTCFCFRRGMQVPVVIPGTQ